jgi:hypothetical protein
MRGIFVRATPDNARRRLAAIEAFGCPVQDLSPSAIVFACAAVVMPGIRSLDDGGFLRAFQVIDGSSLAGIDGIR